MAASPWSERVQNPTPVQLSEHTPAQRRALLDVARASIRHGLDHGGPLRDFPTATDPMLRLPRASFVTLHRASRLRGCIGEFEARRPLIESVAHNAWAAAFRDPRFPALREDEFETVDIHVSVLSPPVAIGADSEPELLATLQPGVDGVLLRQGHHSSTFLPQVWEQLPEPADFLRHLRRKAGLPDPYDASATYLRYGVEAFGEA